MFVLSLLLAFAAGAHVASKVTWWTLKRRCSAETMQRIRDDLHQTPTEVRGG